jgi:hypothetical protein
VYLGGTLDGTEGRRGALSAGIAAAMRNHRAVTHRQAN